MTGPEEHADRARGIGSFPSEWGPPRGRQFSAERREWVRENVLRQLGANAHRKLAARDARHLAELRQALLERKRKGPE